MAQTQIVMEDGRTAVWEEALKVSEVGTWTVRETLGEVGWSIDSAPSTALVTNARSDLMTVTLRLSFSTALGNPKLCAPLARGMCLSGSPLA
jgi:hypothetical protein